MRLPFAARAVPLALCAVALLVVLMSPRAGAVDEPDELVAGRVALVKDGLLLKFVGRNAVDLVLPGPGIDPNTLGGALRAFDTVAPGSGDETFIRVDGHPWGPRVRAAGGTAARGCRPTHAAS
jgi:hypothetical protein